MAFGFSKREKDTKESDRLFEKVEQLPEVVFDNERAEMKIELSARFLAAQYCASPKAPDIGKELQRLIQEDDNRKYHINHQRDELLRQIEAVNRSYIHNMHFKLTARANEVQKMYQSKSDGETKNMLNGQVTKLYRTNESTIAEIQDRILADRTRIQGMQQSRLRDIFAEIDKHNSWFKNLDLDEITPDEEISIPGQIPKWARNEA